MKIYVNFFLSILYFRGDINESQWEICTVRNFVAFSSIIYFLIYLHLQPNRENTTFQGLVVSQIFGGSSL
jgi:hypothetical protein